MWCQNIFSVSAFFWWQVTSVPYDERPLPALQRKDQPLEATQSPAEEHSPISEVQRTPQSTEMSGEPEPLTEKVLREAGLPIEVFGESLVRKDKHMWNKQPAKPTIAVNFPLCLYFYMSGSQWASGSDYTHKHNFCLCSKGIDLFFTQISCFCFQQFWQKIMGIVLGHIPKWTKVV